MVSAQISNSREGKGGLILVGVVKLNWDLRKGWNFNNEHCGGGSFMEK